MDVSQKDCDTIPLAWKLGIDQRKEIMGDPMNCNDLLIQKCLVKSIGPSGSASGQKLLTKHFKNQRHSIKGLPFINQYESHIRVAAPTVDEHYMFHPCCTLQMTLYNIQIVRCSTCLCVEFQLHRCFFCLSKPNFFLMLQSQHGILNSILLFQKNSLNSLV